MYHFFLSFSYMNNGEKFFLRFCGNLWRLVMTVKIDRLFERVEQRRTVLALHNVRLNSAARFGIEFRIKIITQM